MTATASPSTDILKSLGITDINPGGFGGEWIGSGPDLEVTSPADGSRIATVKQVTEEEYDEIVRQLGNKLREKKRELGALVTLEMGKITAEGEGEVQERPSATSTSPGWGALVNRPIGDYASPFPSRRRPR